MPYLSSNIIPPILIRIGPYQPMNLFRVNIAAIGNVLLKVPLMSLAASFATGAW